MRSVSRPCILLVDDEEEVLDHLLRVLSIDRYSILTAGSAEQGLEILDDEAEIDLVMSDLFMPGMKGTEFLREVRKRSPDTVRILITGYADFDAAVLAINEGKVFRIVVKPWNNSELREVVKQALKYRRMLKAKKNIKARLHDQEKVIANMEQQFPGITVVQSTADGSIVLDDRDSAEAVDLLRKLSI